MSQNAGDTDKDKRGTDRVRLGIGLLTLSKTMASREGHGVALVLPDKLDEPCPASWY